MTEERDAFAAQELIKRYAPLEFVYPYRTSEPCVAVGCGVREDGGPPPYCSELCWLRATYAYQQEERGDDARLARSRRGGWRRVASRAVQATHRTHPGPAGERGSVTTAEMDEAIAEAGHAVANGDRADVMRIARALLALDCEVTDLTATRDTARAECERLTAQLDAVTCDCGVHAITFAEVPK